jgi:hypothetical protein
VVAVECTTVAEQVASTKLRCDLMLDTVHNAIMEHIQIHIKYFHNYEE